MDHQELKLLASMIADELEKRHNAPLASKWQHGTMIFKPGDSTLKQHEMSIERFMQKIVMMRDNLRVLEQQINANGNLSVAEKIKLQGYITKIYGSMTSFNIVFADEDDKFRGAGGGE
ncbi:MAG: hypothetical protein FJ211_05140 [Ignavibacteria bacterium]|nr:hypothetical protein [Ignavibacteria bacterium]